MDRFIFMRPPLNWCGRQKIAMRKEKEIKQNTLWKTNILQKPKIKSLDKDTGTGEEFA